MSRRPGGVMSARPLPFYWIVDCSGSMSLNGKMSSLNESVRTALPEMRRAAADNPFAQLELRTLAFSHGSRWLGSVSALDDFEWTDLTADPLAANTPMADVVFLLDTSGSMGDEIDGVKQSCHAFADEVIKRGAQVRLGLVGFDIGGFRGRPPDALTVRKLSTYTIGLWQLQTPNQFKRNVQKLRLGMFGGRGCYLANEDTLDIFPHVSQLFGDEEAASQRFLVIISDEIGSTAGVPAIVEQLKAARITAHVMGLPGPHKAHEQIARQTGGQFWNIRRSKGTQDFSQLLAQVADVVGREATKTLADGSQSSGTDLGAALKAVAGAMEVASMPARGLPPVMVLITDGRPTDDFEEGLATLLRQPWGKRAVRIGIGIGTDADLDVLNRFISNPEIKPLHANNPDTLTRFIRWVSTAVVAAASAPASQSTGQAGAPNVTMPPPPELAADRFAFEHIW